MAASKQASIHTHFRNAVTLVWGLLRLAPMREGKGRAERKGKEREGGGKGRAERKGREEREG